MLRSGRGWINGLGKKLPEEFVEGLAASLRVLAGICEQPVIQSNS